MVKKKKKKLKLKYGVKKFLVYFIVFIILISYSSNEWKKIKARSEYENSYEYKLIQKKYPEEEAKLLSSTLKEENLKQIITQRYNNMYYQLLTQKYYLNKNFDKYLDYIKNHKSASLETVIKTVNTHNDTKWYSGNYKANTDLGYSMLVNRYYELNKDYVRVDLEPIPLTYSYGSYGSNKAAKIVIEQFDLLQQDVKRDFNVQLMVNDSYRSYSEQEKEHKLNGDNIATRPGYSEHQTGLVLDISHISLGNGDKFTSSEVGQWLLNNIHKYGFIYRYPEGQEDITGYTHPWHLRYVGKDLAEKIYNEKITFEEYYAYYIEGDE